MRASKRAAMKTTTRSRKRARIALLAFLVGCSGYAGDEEGSGDLPAWVNGNGNGPNSASGSGNGSGSEGGATLGGSMICYYSEQSGQLPAATVEYVGEVVDGTPQTHIRVTFALAFVDNSYGVNSIGWGKRGHWWKDLEKSDHAEVILSDGVGADRMQFKMDYISADPSTPSGYATLGVWGGDGSMIMGDEAHVLGVMTSLDRNLNVHGYSSYTVDSPPTDEDYTPSAEAPLWDYRMQYDVWVDDAAFGSAGFGTVDLEYVHASPSKTSDDTWKVERDDCPPFWIPGGNDTGAGGGPGSGSGGSDGSGGYGGSGGNGGNGGDGGSNDTGAGGYDSGSGGNTSGSGGDTSGSGGYTSGSGGSNDTGAGGYTSGSGGSNDTGAGGYDSGSGGFSIPTGSGGSNDTGAGGYDSGSGGFSIPTGSGGSNDTGAGGSTSGSGGSGGSTDSGAGGSTSGSGGSGGSTDSGAGGGGTGCYVQSCNVNADCPNYYACYSGCCYEIPQ
jgi:hypothetical protein